jgi:hypothetical protein
MGIKTIVRLKAIKLFVKNTSPQELKGKLAFADKKSFCHVEC